MVHPGKDSTGKKSTGKEVDSKEIDRKSSRVDARRAAGGAQWLGRERDVARILNQK
jgi:hypothetical protein